MTNPSKDQQVFREIAERECAAALKVVREAYSPSRPIEEIMIAAFIHGAGWACANLMPEDTQ